MYKGEAVASNMNRVEALNDLGFRAQRNEEVEVGVSDIGVNEQTPGPGFGHGELEEDFVEEDGDPIPNNIEGCIWMLNNYVKNIAKERKGFEKLLTAAEHMFPGNVNLIGFADKYIDSLKCTWGSNNSGANATMPQTQEKEKDIQGEAGCPNMNRVEALYDVGFQAQRNEEVEVGVSDIGVNEQTPGSGKDLMGLTKNSCVDVVVEKESLFGFDRQENMCGVLTQKAFESVADEVERSIEKSKIMEIDDRPSFSFGVTQDFDVVPVTNNEKKVLTPMPISAYTPEGEASDIFMFHGKRVTSKSNIMMSRFYSRVAGPDVGLGSEESRVTKYLFMMNHESYTDILFKSKSGQQSDRLQMESMGQDYVETNILDTWEVVRNYMEEYRSNDSPFRLFLPTFVVDKDSFSQIRNHDGRFEIGFGHGELEEDFVEEDGDPIPNNIEGCIWMLNNYVKNIAKERKGFEKLLTAAEHLFPGNINLVGFADKYINSLKCIWGGNNSGINATMPQTQEKEKDVQGEAGCPNMNRVEALNDLGFRAQRNEEVEVGVRDIGVNEQTPGPGKDLIGVTKNSCAVVVVEKGALFGFDRQENMCEVLTQKAFESVADEV
ncbi:hypothetical protein Tco_0532942 [Tanacetum coccineum]